VFAIHDCGYVARSAQETEDSGEVRVEKIYRIVRDCRNGIHDISRAGVNKKSGAARFNMPLELGVFLGAKKYGDSRQKEKRCLVLDRERYRYQRFCSDIAGQDIRAHHDLPSGVIRAVRDWLSGLKKGIVIPSGSKIAGRYSSFTRQLSRQAKAAQLNPGELTFGDYIVLVVGWLEENPW